MNKIKSFAKRFMNDESGQGMAEYVLLIVVVVGIAVLFKERIRGMVSGKLDSVAGEFGNFTSGEQ